MYLHNIVDCVLYAPLLKHNQPTVYPNAQPGFRSEGTLKSNKGSSPFHSLNFFVVIQGIIPSFYIPWLMLSDKSLSKAEVESQSHFSLTFPCYQQIIIHSRLPLCLQPSIPLFHQAARPAVALQTRIHCGCSTNLPNQAPLPMLLHSQPPS